MTLVATAVINGLTMLRAYNCITFIEGIGDGFGPGQDDAGHIMVYVNKAKPELHPDDVRRLEAEGWEWDEHHGRWEL